MKSAFEVAAPGGRLAAPLQFPTTVNLRAQPEPRPSAIIALRIGRIRRSPSLRLMAPQTRVDGTAGGEGANEMTGHNERLADRVGVVGTDPP